MIQNLLKRDGQFVEAQNFKVKTVEVIDDLVNRPTEKQTQLGM